MAPGGYITGDDDAAYGASISSPSTRSHNYDFRPPARTMGDILDCDWRHTNRRCPMGYAGITRYPARQARKRPQQATDGYG